MAKNETQRSDEEPATNGYVKRIIRKKLAKQDHGEHHGLNIYPMMDMMTILLVFMVMQFASSSASVITQSDELQIPYSTSTKDVEEGMLVQITKNSLTVDGKQVANLTDGKVDPGDKQNGSNGFKIQPMARVLKEKARIQKAIFKARKKPFKGDTTIVADGNTPYRTISEVMYTLGQYEFKNMRFLVDKDNSKAGQ